MNYFRHDRGNVTNLNFNQDHGCFSCSMDNGLRIYNVEPLQEKLHLDASIVGSVALCEMLYRTNILAIVGGGRRQKFADNAVLLWDDHGRKFVSEFTFSSAVLSVRLRKDKLFVTQRSEIHVFSFPNNPAKLFMLYTGDNPRGLCETSPFPSSERQLLIYPGHSSGTIQIVDLAKIQPGTSAAPVTVTAHKSNIAYIAINPQGTLVATASIKGTLIRVFDTSTKVMVIELRRGTDSATLYCINFNSDSEFLCASSDKGTIHIFALKDSQRNRRLKLANATLAKSSYMNSQWAFATFPVTRECKSICSFGPNSSVNAICLDGSFKKYAYTDNGCMQESYDVFLNMSNDRKF